MEQNETLTFYHIRYLIQDSDDKLYIQALDTTFSDHCSFIEHIKSDERFKSLSAEYLGETHYDLVGNIIKYDDSFPSVTCFFSVVCGGPATQDLNLEV